MPLFYASFTFTSSAHADQILETVTDFVADGRLHFHPKNFAQSYYDQIEEAKPFIARFVETRLPKFLGHFGTFVAHFLVIYLIC